MSIQVNTRIDKRLLALGYDILLALGRPAKSNAEVVRVLFSAGLINLEPDYQNREPSQQGWLYATGSKLPKGE